MSAYEVSLILPCYWATEELIDITVECLNSLNDTTNAQPSEVLIINDGSPINAGFEDETDFAQHMEQIDRKKNGGYAAAVNTGLFHATGDILIISNNDIEFIQPDWLTHLLKPLHEGYAISSIRTTDSDGWETDDYYEDDAKFGSLWAMKREVYETIGGLDESFGKGYFEDLDYQKRATLAGFKVVKNHAGIAEHKGKATFKVTDPDDSAYFAAMERFKEKYGKVE